jgi:membrane protease YdiL (CAAX protease family)
MFVVGIGSYLWMLLYPLGVAHRRLGRWPRLPRFRAVAFEALFALVLLPAVIVTMSLAFPVFNRLTAGSGVPNNPLEWAARSGNSVDWPFIIIMVLAAAPVAEEVLFRGLLYSALRQRIPVILAIPIQAIVFGFLHLFDVATSATVAVIGVFLGCLYEWRKTLLSPMILHALVNTVAIVSTLAGLEAAANGPAIGITGTHHDGVCEVTRVMPRSGADDAGLMTGDIIATVDGNPVADIPALARVVRTKNVGDRVSIEFMRGGEHHTVHVVLKRRGY